MLLLALLLVPAVLATSEERTIDNHVVRIEDGRLTRVLPTEKFSTALDLSSLGLRNLKKGVFDHLVTLRSLSLANNSLSSVPKRSFSRLSSLEHLSLANNDISAFHKVCIGLDRLRTLNISYNPVPRLRNGELHGLPNTSVVLTKGLNLISIKTDVFSRPFEPDYDYEEANEEEENSEEKDNEEKNKAEKNEEKNNEENNKAEKNNEEKTKAEKNNEEKTKAEKNNEEKNKAEKNNEDEDDDDDYGDEAPKRPILRIKLCLDDGVVKLAEPMKPNEVLPTGCRRLPETGDVYHLKLSKLGISGFATGWSRLNDTPIGILHLAENEITQVTPATLNGLPFHGFNLAYNRIERLEKGVIDNQEVLRLNLSSNRISEIQDGALADTTLFDLFLANNLLEDTKFLASLPSSVLRIDLGFNRIASIAPNSFARLEKLTLLSLNGNLIERLDSDAFLGLPRLTELSLSNNRISAIGSGCFQRTSFLHFLYLRNNNISRFQEGVFGDKPLLRHLNVGLNRLSSIREGFPGGLPPELEVLKLDGNGIERLERGDFPKVPKGHLSLIGNRISRIEPGAFDLPGLLTLNLGNNRLGHLDVDAFRGLGYILSLSLDANGITELPKGFTKVFGNLRLLNLNFNPIKRLENGALVGLRGGHSNFVGLNGVPVELVEAGVFEDM